MKWFLITLVAIILLTSDACGSYTITPEGRKLQVDASQENVGLFEYTPVLVSEYDGCRIYKFWSSEGPNTPNWHFFVRCSGETTTTTNSSYTTSDGNNTYTHHFIDEVSCAEDK
jgi:hypothetical protein